jgi:hypothetical protein
MGRIQTANNGDARVSRTYYPNGLLQTETQRIRTLAKLSEGGDTTSHQYTLTYTYDRNGRRKELQHPANLTPVVSGVIKDRTRYDYHPFGALNTVTDILDHVYRYKYTPRTEVDSVFLPRGWKEHFTYNPDGNLERHVLRNASGALVRNLTLNYDARGRMIQSAGQPDTLRAWHSGLGHLVRSSRVAYGLTVEGLLRQDVVHESFTNDALGNLRTMVTYDTVRLNGSDYQRGVRDQWHSYAITPHASTAGIRSAQSTRPGTTSPAIRPSPINVATRLMQRWRIGPRSMTRKDGCAPPTSAATRMQGKSWLPIVPRSKSIGMTRWDAASGFEPVACARTIPTRT